MANKAPESFGSASDHRRNSWRVVGLVTGILLLVAAVAGGFLYFNAQNDPALTAQQAELQRQKAIDFNESRTTLTGKLKDVSDKEITITISGKKSETYTVSTETEFNRGNNYEVVAADQLKPGAVVSVTYLVDSRQAVGVWQQDE